MASTKESNSSKTAHVMNLLSRTRGGAAPSEPAPEAAAGTAAPETAAPETPKAPPQAPIPPILSSMEADAAVSTQIKDALEDALTSELEAAAEPAQPDPPPPPPVAKKILPQEKPAPAMDWPELGGEDGEPEAEEAAPEAPETPEPQAAAPETPEAPKPQAAAAQEAPSDHHEITYVNVMEVLVEERAGKYMEMFGMCQCERCKVDVKALALNNLPSKYVVMAKGEFVPRITVYEGRFSAAIIAQLLRACKLVADAPRHSKPEGQ